MRARYAAAAQSASCCSTPLDDSSVFGGSQYDDSTKSLLPEEAIIASLGCGNPTVLADLQPGEIVLDLGSGGGSTCCCRRNASDRPAKPTDWT